MSFGKEEIVAASDAIYKTIYTAIGSKIIGPGDVLSTLESTSAYFKALSEGDYKKAAMEAANLAATLAVGAALAEITAAAVIATGATVGVGLAAGIIVGGGVAYAVEKSGLGKEIGEEIYDELNGDGPNFLEMKINDFGKFFLPLALGPSVVPFDPEGEFGANISSDAKFDLAQKFQPRRDPLTIDLDGDGLETVGANEIGSVLFDHDGDGLKTRSGWVKPDDGLLVLDRNGNGTIDTGAELFGDSTVKSNGQKAVDGFDALADLDSNHDGKLNAADARFAELRVWRDLNSDGISTANELLTLQAAGIAEFNVAKKENSQTLSNGNQIADTGSYVRTNGELALMGEIGHMADVDLAEDTFHREFTTTIPLDEDVKDLPAMQGSGKVRDLLEAASQSDSLKALLQQYVAIDDREGQIALIDQMLDDWADTSGMAKTLDEQFGPMFYIKYESFGNIARRDNVTNSQNGVEILSDFYKNTITEWNKKLHVLQAFNGRYFFSLGAQGGGSAASGLVLGSNANGGGSGQIAGSTPLLINFSQTQIDLLSSAYDALKESIYAGLVLQTRLKPYLDEVKLVINDEGVAFDFSGISSKIATLAATDPKKALTDLFELNKYVPEMLDAGFDGLNLVSSYLSNPIYSTIAAQLHPLFGVEGLWNGGKDSDFAFGSANADTFHGKEGDDRLLGMNGNDTLYGEAGNDILDGGIGNDNLNGGDGSDTFVFRKGSGQDVIVQNDNSSGRIDTIQFTDVNSTELTGLRRVGNNLIISYGIDDQVTLIDYYRDNSASFQINQLVFADTIWNFTQLIAAYPISLTDAADNLTLTGDSEQVFAGLGDDSVHGGAGNDSIYGEVGNDWLTGDGGNDVVFGGDGDDAVGGDAGNDTLDGGAGNDYLDGGNGSDTFVFRKGSSQDVIVQNDNSSGRIDTIQFTNVNSTELTGLRRVGNNLVISYGIDDQVTLIDYYRDNSASFQINQLVFADTIWNFTQLIAAYPITLTDVADNLTLTGDSEQVFAGSGNDNIHGGAGNDSIYGEVGNDWLTGDSGNDAIFGGDGDDAVGGDAGNDTLNGGAGNDYLDGGNGSDTFVFRKGSGQDRIAQNDNSSGRLDTIQFIDVNSTELTSLQRNGNNLIISYGINDQLTLTDYYRNGNASYQIDRITFADVAWSFTQLLESYPISVRLSDMADSLTLTNSNEQIFSGAGNDSVHGGAGNDNLYGEAGNDWLTGDSGNDAVFGDEGDDAIGGDAGNDTLDGGLGNDYLDGGEGNDLLTGAAGNDALYGRNGNDVLEGGTGDDYLDGAIGNDIYVLGRGAGSDTISDVDTGVGNFDQIQYTDGVAYDQLWFSRSGNDLAVSIIGTMDKALISNWYGGANSQIEKLVTADGKTLLNTEVNALVAAMASFSPPPVGQTSLTQLQQDQLQPVFAANWH